MTAKASAHHRDSQHVPSYCASIPSVESRITGLCSPAGYGTTDTIMGDYHPSAETHHTVSHTKAQNKPRFIITGFGRFCGVSNNPTEQLMVWLRQRGCDQASLAANPPAACQTPGMEVRDQPYCVSSIDVLDVSASAVDAFMQKQHELLLQHPAVCSSTGRQPVVLLHFGVDTQRPGISLEVQAYNNATFSCPDQSGWQPQACLIEAAPGLGTSSVRTTTLPLQELVQQLRDAGFECGMSRDAGRFVCNYTYYRSLQLTSKLQQQLVWQHRQQKQQLTAARTTDLPEGNGSGSVDVSGSGQSRDATGSLPDGLPDHGWPCFSLFVHMPSFSVVNQAKQREFVLHLLDLVATWVVGTSQAAVS